MANLISSLRKQASTQIHESPGGQRDEKRGELWPCPAPRTALRDAQRRGNVAYCPDILYRERGGTFRAVPDVKGVPIGPILSAFGSNLFTTALNALYAKAQTTIGLHRRHGNLLICLRDNQTYYGS